MKRLQYLLWIFALPVVLIIGCSNPADNVPEAVVGDSMESPAVMDEAGKAFVFSPDSKIEFTGSKITGSHNGGFKSFEGRFSLVDGDPITAQGEIAIQMDSLWSDNERLTGHLKGPDFFDVEKFPASVFSLIGVVKKDSGYEVTGDLDLHGVKKSITFPATVQVSPDEITLKAEFFIKRFDFKIEYPGKADDLIRDEVVIRLDLIAKPKA